MFRDVIDNLDHCEPPGDMFLDVPFVPSDDEIVQVMLRMADLSPKDLVIDLGSGDGRILIEAAKTYRARGIGFDIDPVQIADAMERAGEAGMEYLVDFIEEDLFEVDVSAATVVTLYLLDPINIQLRPRLLSMLQPGSRIISHVFDMGDWQADAHERVNGSNVYKWVVPAQVEGMWDWVTEEGQTFQVNLSQHYQEVDGQAWHEGQQTELLSAVLCGKDLDLSIQEAQSKNVREFGLSFSEGMLETVVEYI